MFILNCQVNRLDHSKAESPLTFLGRDKALKIYLAQNNLLKVKIFVSVVKNKIIK